jgi:two-component system NtrC family sensor kinase
LEQSAQLMQAEKMGALGIMAAGIAHELLNPLVGILNYVQFCRKRTAEDDPRHDVLQDIERETERCTDIVKNVVTFSRTEQEGEEEYQKESLATIIERVVKLLSYRIGAEKVTLTRHVAEGTPAIPMKVNGMQQVLLNLITNAMDAVKESEKKEVNVEVYQEGGFIRVNVSDSGVGIAPENMEKLFDPFFTTKPADKGTGLGLTIVRSIVQAHGGEITCQSEPGAGTTFSMLLPIKNEQEVTE